MSIGPSRESGANHGSPIRVMKASARSAAPKAAIAAMKTLPA